ncbi:hypothetical protein ACHAXT_005854 [Thalassiosira profunda]
MTRPTSILLLVLPTASCLVPHLSIQQVRSARHINTGGTRHLSRAIEEGSSTRLSLGIDPTDVAQHAELLHHHAAAAATHHDAASTLDMLSSLTLAKASSLVPNQSLAPLPETIKPAQDVVELIPDLPAMPGGAPRSGNPFLAESFKELYNGALTATPQSQPVGSDGAMVVPAREWDVVARYADLLSRIPLAAAVYALVDFFLINAEEDVAIAELLDEEERVAAIVEVENRVIMQRIIGLLCVVAATVGWSLISYHPVPFGEL